VRWKAVSKQPTWRTSGISEQRLDGAQVVGLVQGRQRDQGFKFGDHFGREHHRAP
jgi:hypothetical protein